MRSVSESGPKVVFVCLGGTPGGGLEEVGWGSQSSSVEKFRVGV